MKGQGDLRVCIRIGVLSLFAAGIVAAGSARAQKGVDPSGLWITETGASKVRVAPCGGGFCGTLMSTSGPGLDANNPDPALRGRKLVGVQIFSAGTASGEGFEGNLYNPQDGKTYSGTITPKGPNSLEVAGCVMRVLCKRQTWRRAQ